MMTSKIKSFFRRFRNSATQKVPRDPVCGMKATTGITSAYNGQTYNFCSGHCKEQFDEDPAVYI